MFSLSPHLGGGSVQPGGGQVSPAGGGSVQRGGGVSPAGRGGVSQWGRGVSILRPLAGSMPLAFTQEDFLVLKMLVDNLPYVCGTLLFTFSSLNLHRRQKNSQVF